MAKTIHQLLNSSSSCSRLLEEYRKRYGRKVTVRDKPWWFPFKKAVTTTKTTIWWSPGREYRASREALPTLAHELQHELDMSQGSTVLWYLLYISPQVWALLMFFGFFGLMYWPLWYLFGAVIFLLPWPSRWRAETEHRGYAVSAFCKRRTNQSYDMEAYAEKLTSVFGSVYYKASWSKSKSLRKITDHFNDGTELTDLLKKVV